MSLIYSFKTLPKKIFFIYCLIDPKSGQVRYIGKTCSKYRPQSHYSNKNNRIKKRHCATWIRSLAPLVPIREILEFCNTYEELNPREQYWIAYYRKFNSKKFKLTNHTEGGEGTLGYKHTKADKLKSSLAHKKRGKTIAHNATQVIDQYGTLYSSITEAAKAIKCSRSAIKILISGKVKYVKVKGFSFIRYKNLDGSINKQSFPSYVSKQERIKILRNTSRLNFKPVQELDSDFVYLSSKHLAEDLGVAPSTVAHHLRGEGLTLKGKKYKFYTKV